MNRRTAVKSMWIHVGVAATQSLMFMIGPAELRNFAALTACFSATMALLIHLWLVRDQKNSEPQQRITVTSTNKMAVGEILDFTPEHKVYRVVSVEGTGPYVATVKEMS